VNKDIDYIVTRRMG